MSIELLHGITAETTGNQRDIDAARAWITQAAKSGISAVLVGMPIDGFSDGDGGALLALVRVNGENVVLTISDPYSKQHTVRAREPRDREIEWFSDANL